MGNESSNSQNVSQIILEGEAQEIFDAIQSDASLCLKKLIMAESQREIESTDGEGIRHHVKANLDEAGEIRFSLNTVDNRIHSEKNKSEFRQKFDHYIQFNNVNDSIVTLLDFVLREIKNASSQPSQIIVKVLEPLIAESMQHRILLIVCWDEILKEQRALLVFRMIHDAHRLTEIAILLQDNDAIQTVRNLLQSLDLEMPKSVKIGNLPSNLGELKEMLNEGVVGLLETKQEIHEMDKQRKALKTNHNIITNRLNALGSKPASPTFVSRGTNPLNIQKTSGMAFRSKKR